MNNDPINAWWQASQELAIAKKREKELRDACIAAIFPNYAFGTNTQELGNDWRLNCKVPQVFKLSSPQEVTAAQNATVAAGASVELVARLVKWKPELSKRDYDLLTEEQRNAFNSCVTMEQGSICLEMKIPKSEGG